MSIESPTPEDIRAARIAAGLTQSAAGELLHTALRTWQQWEAGHRKMHAAFWELFRIKAKAGTYPAKARPQNNQEIHHAQ